MAKAKSLVIVESPAKAKTIEKFLGRKYRVMASMGHVRDLPKSQMGVDTEDGFAPRYITIRGKGPVLQELRTEAKKADAVLLATDPDREGEAISWHLAHVLELAPDAKNRIVFNEITKEAIQRAVKEPRPIDQDRVDAQQARRILDRLVGYQLSPLLWRKVRRGLSAGRVQSVAVRLICDREEEIENFDPEEYWTLDGRFRAPANGDFTAAYYGSRGKKVKLGSKDEVDALLGELEGAEYRVREVQKRERRRNPAAAFTTSSLQQEASRKLGFTVRRTMRTAQALYEGLPIKGEGTVGLITYIRTDSTRISQQAQDDARGYVLEHYGEKYSQPSKGRARAGAQDAHEAIRPTSVSRHPDTVKADLTRDQYRLYKLVWDRFVASQMSPAVYDTVTVRIEAGAHEFRATGSTLKFAGFMELYIEGRDDEAEDENGANLPEIREGELLKLLKFNPEQHFTQPPPRYTEAMLVKTLEEKGIGRPSTYAPIIETIQQRGYVAKEEKRFRPTELGQIVTDLLIEHFPSIVDAEFTARLEQDLDQIEEGDRPWHGVVESFYQPFAETLSKADKEIEEVELPEEVTDEICEKCGRNMVIKHGRFGRFLACPGFPECRNTKPLLEKTGVDCPRCGGELVERRSRKGRRFYGCINYPECDFVVWNRPVRQPCPKCGGLMVLKGSRRSGQYLQCTNEGCKHRSQSKERETTTV